jgi:endonuclease IV
MYLLNPGTASPAARARTVAAMTDEVARVAALGLCQYNFHPGSDTGGDDAATAVAAAGGGEEGDSEGDDADGEEEGAGDGSEGAAAGTAAVGAGGVVPGDVFQRIASVINEVHASVPGVTLVIETMAGSGRTVGGRFEDIAAIIGHVADKSRVGVCIDTAHSHAAGYDMRTAGGYEAMMARFDAVVGLRYLRGMHLNDSMVALGSRVDRHWHIGKGCVGVEAFRAIMNDGRTAGVPLILETPTIKGQETRVECCGKYGAEIGLLYGLQGTAAGDAVPDVGLPALPEKAARGKAAAKRGGVGGKRDRGTADAGDGSSAGPDGANRGASKKARRVAAAGDEDDSADGE